MAKRVTVAHSNKRAVLRAMQRDLNVDYPHANLTISGEQGRWKLRGDSPPLPDKACLNLYRAL